jgi:hypothetical protein
MSVTRFQMLTQAQRNLDMADLLAANGDYDGAARNTAAARALIFTESTNPPSRSVAASPNNTGSCSAGRESLLTA